MKKLAVGVVAAWTLFNVCAEELPWMTDLPKAQAKAKTENKMVLMDFNGSDWCPPCKMLRSKVFGSAEFAEFAKKNLILVDLDFPRQKSQPEEIKKANAELSKKYGIEGFPTVIVLGSDGKELKKTVGYDGSSAKDFVAELAKLKKEG